MPSASGNAVQARVGGIRAGHFGRRGINQQGKTMKTTSTKSAKSKKAPTFEEMKAVVQAWVKANWPDAEHITLTEWSWSGAGVEEVDVLGPPEGKFWFTQETGPSKGNQTQHKLGEKIGKQN
jgi:hypothetical protein